MKSKRGDVYWVRLDPTLSTEIQTARPCVVVSNNQANDRYHQITVIPLTTQHADRVEPFQTFIPSHVLGVSKDSKALAEQIRTVSKIRLGKLVGRLPLGVIERVDESLRIHLGL